MKLTVNPNVTRCAAMLELATGLARWDSGTAQQVSIALEDRSSGIRLSLSSDSSSQSLEAVIAGAVDIAVVNPAAALMQAARGIGPFRVPQPLRTIAVLPSQDSLVFAVRTEVSGETVEALARARMPLKVSVRGRREHCIHQILEDILSRVSWGYGDIGTSGGQIVAKGGIPEPGSERLRRFANREVDAIFDEGADEWLEAAVAAGGKIIGFEENTVQALERSGYRRSWLRKSRHPCLPKDVLTIDFSGWPIFVRSDLSDERVLRLCQVLELRVGSIPWAGAESLDLATMCRDTEAAPIMAPLHEVAAKFWRDQGYL
jgi:TRAP-type uncharacterized transport system substrate-binding protein